MNKLKTIHLYGKLKEICGGNDTVRLAGGNMQILVSGLTSMFGPEVREHIQTNNWQVYKNKDLTEDIGEEDIRDGQPLDADELHFFPAVEGSGRAGRIIAGIVLIVVGAIITGLSYGWAAPVGNALISMGIGLILQGLFMPNAQKERDKPDERASFMFNGPVNTIEQGGPVFLMYGRFRGGSTVVSAGIDAESIATYTSPLNTNNAPNSAFNINPV